MDPILIHQIREDEGREACVYKDTKGRLTIADGILVDPSVPGAGLRPEEMDFITGNRVMIETPLAAQVVGQQVWAELNPARRRVIVNLVHNMGPHRLSGFVKFLADLKAGNYGSISRDETGKYIGTGAAGELLDSEWAREVKDRAVRRATQMATGIDQ